MVGGCGIFVYLDVFYDDVILYWGDIVVFL